MNVHGVGEGLTILMSLLDYIKGLSEYFTHNETMENVNPINSGVPDSPKIFCSPLPTALLFVQN